MPQVFNTFPSPGSDSSLRVIAPTVEGNFYDYKSRVKFNVSMEVDPDYTLDDFTVDIDTAAVTTAPHVEHIQDAPRAVNGYNLERNIYKGSVAGMNSEGITYPFVNGVKYKIVYTALFRLRTGPVFGSTVSLKSTSHIQLFTYYDTPVTLSTFRVTNDVATGDDIQIAGLSLIRSSVDETEPEYLTFTFQDNDAEPGDGNNPSEINEPYIVRQAYSSSGGYTLPSNTLTNGSTYTMNVSAQYALGYSTSQTKHDLLIFNRPSIASIDVLPLYIRNTSDNVATVTLSETLEGQDNLTKLWFQFKTTDASANLVATVGDVVGIAYDELSLAYSFSLSEIVKELTQSLYIENDISYNVVVKAQYVYNGSNIIRYSSPYPVTFDLTEPAISNIVVNSLYTRDTNEKIATITVDYDAYELYAPYETAGIKFVFYKGETEVARTIAYDFVNTSDASGNTDYDIKLSEVNSVNGYLDHGITYTVKAAVKVTDHAGTTSYVVSSASYSVTFALTEPDISNIVVNSLYLVDPNEKIATITVDHDAYKLYAPYATDGIKFVFYNGSTEVARTTPYTFANTSAAAGNTNYDIKLSEITPKVLENDITYTVKAAVKVTDHAGTTTSYVVSSDSYSVTFPLVRPVISITPYDVQNDGGADGVYAPSDGATDSDTASQIVATVTVNLAEYKLYAPNETEGILFVFYDASENEIARTDPYTFANISSSSQNLYNIRLNEITVVSGNDLLTNGTPYKVKAEVTLVNHSDVPEQRLSAAFFDVTFTQNIAPVPYVNISNSWALVTADDPESYRANFLVSPEIGISGNFSKNAQFGSVYSKQLDTTSTIFKLEYKVTSSTSTVTQDWTPVKKAKLVLQGSSESLETAADRARSTAGSLSTVNSGEYANIPGTGLGTDQGDIVFYMPYIQSGTAPAFDETDVVEVKVTVIDRSTPSLWSGNILSDYYTAIPVHVIKKIDQYNYTTGTDTEPWNSQYKAYYDSSTSLLHVDVNDTIVTTNKSNVKADSNNIIQELDEGWKIVNTDANTNGATGGKLPKVNLYFYGNSVAAGSQNSSNSFTVSQINDMGAVIDQHAGAKEYPYFIVYTTPTGSSDKASWYKSKLFYAPQSSGDTSDPDKVGLTLLYTGMDDTTFRPEIPAHRRIRYDLLAHDGVLTNANAGYANERVNSVSLHTSSNASTSEAGSFNFTLQEAGLMTTSSVLSLLVMRFTKKLLVLNIPVYWNSAYSYSAKVDYNYDDSANYYEPIEFLKSSHPSTVSITVDPTIGTTLYYRVRYVVTNPNLPKIDGVYDTTDGIYTDKDVPNKFFPESSDYAILNAEYKTFNTDASSNITFDLSFNIDPIDHENRMDGVNVYFTSPESSIGSNIVKVRIGSYTTAGPKTITLIDVTDASGVHLEIMDPSGNIVTSDLLWNKYDSANISFEAFRDARVHSSDASYNRVSDASDPVSSDFYVETGTQSTFGTSSDSNPIWNVPVLTRPSTDASGGNIYELSGGVINIESSSNNHFISWPIAENENQLDFTYDIIVTSDASGVIVDEDNLTGPSCVLRIDLDTVDRYVIEIRKVFNGLTNQRERSAADVIVFHSVKVDTENMDVSVVNPSNTSSVTLSWEQAVITGNSVDVSGNSVDVSGNTVISEPASFQNNIYAHHIKYRIDPSGNYARLDDAENAPLIENSSPKLYTLPSEIVPGDLLDFVMYVEAQVKYTLNSELQTKSIPFDVPLTPVTTASQYRVSTIPSIILPHSSPVLVQGSQNPTLLLNLNANGLEEEGFISVVVILTQDGTAAKPEGEQALLIFPDSSNLYPFYFPNTVGTSGSGSSDSRLAGGDSATSAPKNLSSSVLSTDPSNNTYTLTIGTVETTETVVTTGGEVGRYGLSTLQMPLSSQSDFVSGEPVNYMVILTTRRGTDIGVGAFTYQSIPSVQNVEIVTVGGQYFVNFNITPA
jgi:hypothetical protein